MTYTTCGAKGQNKRKASTSTGNAFKNRSSSKQTRYLTYIIFIVSKNKMVNHWTPTETGLLIQNCGYPDEMQDKIMKVTIVFGTDHKVICKKCITKDNDLTFKKACDIAHTIEAIQAKLRAMDTPVPPTQVDSPGARQNKSIESDTPSNRSPRDPTRSQQCSNYQHQRGQPCKASGVESFNCHNRGHFGKMCKSRNIFQIS